MKSCAEAGAAQRGRGGGAGVRDVGRGWRDVRGKTAAERACQIKLYKMQLKIKIF